MKKLSLLLLLFVFSWTIVSQNTIKVPKGYSNDIGQMISMLDNLKSRVERNVANLDQDGTDFLLDENANSPGAIIYHLAATEAYYQVYTFEGRGFNEEEAKKWDTALNLGEKARQEFKGKPLSFYLDLYNEMTGAFQKYTEDVKSGDFPNEKEQY